MKIAKGDLWIAIFEADKGLTVLWSFSSSRFSWVCVREKTTGNLFDQGRPDRHFFFYLLFFIYSNKSGRVNTGKVFEVGMKRSAVVLWCQGLWLLYHHECLLKLYWTSWIMTFEPCAVILLTLVPTGSKQTPSMWTWQAWWWVVQGHRLDVFVLYSRFG